MAEGAADWVAGRIEEEGRLKLVDRTDGGLLVVNSDESGTFPVAVTGVQDVVTPDHVRPVLKSATRPKFVVNVPSKALWRGDAIRLIYGAPAAFGTLGELQKAARSGNVAAYRNKDRAFFERAIAQHDHVRSVSLLYESVIEATRIRGDSLVIALVDAYNMSAEDVRNARARFGRFDIALKMTSYGSVTDAAEAAARSMGAEAMTFKQVMGRLAKR